MTAPPYAALMRRAAFWPDTLTHEEWRVVLMDAWPTESTSQSSGRGAVSSVARGSRQTQPLSKRDRRESSAPVDITTVPQTTLLPSSAPFCSKVRRHHQPGDN